MALFQRMAVIGVGLIGGSLARILREKVDTATARVQRLLERLPEDAT